MDNALSGESRSRNAPLVVVLAILVAVTGVMAWQQHRTSQDLASRIDAIAGMEARVDLQLDAQAAAISDVKSSVDRAIIGRKELLDVTATIGDVKSSVDRAIVAAVSDVKSSVDRAIVAAISDVKSSVDRAIIGRKEILDVVATISDVKTSVDRAIVAAISDVKSSVDRAIIGRKEILDVVATVSDVKTSVDRALGHVVVTQPPEDLRAGVRAVMDRWLPVEQPAELPAAGSDLRDELATLELSMQTGLRSAFESELRRLHWWADSLDAVQSTSEDAVRAESDYPQLRTLRVTAPVRAPQWCFEIVRAAELRRLVALAQARAAQEQNTLYEVDELQYLLDTVHREMGNDVPLVIAEAQARLGARRGAIEAQELSQGIDELVAKRSVAMKKITDLDLNLQVQASYHGQLLGLLSTLAGSDGVDSGRIQSLAEEWAGDMREIGTLVHNDRSQRYQCWALGIIERATREIDAAQGISDDEELIYYAILRLLPIDANLLEPPLRVKFDETWTDGAAELSDYQKGDLLHWVALTPKEGLGDV